MKSKNSALNRLYCDRPLVGDDAICSQSPSAKRLLYTESHADRVGNLFNTILQMALVACLLVSLAIFGWKVSNFSETGASTIASKQSVKQAAPASKVAQVAAPATPRYRMQAPAVSHTLKMSPKFFLLD